MQLGVAQGDGASLRRHLEGALRAGIVDPRLAESRSPLPPAVRPLWSVFLDLSATRHEGAPISWQELEAWERRHGRLTPWEAETVMAMDQAALAVPQKGSHGPGLSVSVRNGEPPPGGAPVVPMDQRAPAAPQKGTR